MNATAGPSQRPALFQASVQWFARLALAASFLSAVADRFGLWGAPGAPHVAWGDFPHFVVYTAKLTWYLPFSLSRALAWAATIAEIVLSLWLITGLYLRLAALLSGVLLLLFALSMTAATSIKAPFDDSVFTAAAAAFLLAVTAPALPRRT